MTCVCGDVLLGHADPGNTDPDAKRRCLRKKCPCEDFTART